MAHGFSLFGHGQVVLHVAGVVVVGIGFAMVIPSPLRQEEAGQAQVFRLARNSVELDQADFDFLMTRNIAPLPGTEGGGDEVSVLHRDL